ncbi:MAG: hypothetical protein QGG40_16955, partial [Myxococcota bacterium]|nr:hypothetical protein [Myxococcota bacterium]
DYHIGVVTTDTNRDDAGEVLGQVLTTETADAEEVFAEIVSLGTDGAGYEMGLHSAYLALTPPLSTSTNSTFLRDDAYLSVIFVSDEEDSSPLPVNDYINVFREVKGARSRDSFNASSLVVTDIDECGAESVAWGATEGTRYIDVAEQTGGILGSICADNFDDIVTDLSMATSRLTDTFYLSALPDASTLTLYVDDEEYPCDDGKWAYYLSEEDSGISYTARIVFEADYLPPPSSQITARYNYGGGGEDGFCSSGEDEESSEEEGE